MNVGWRSRPAGSSAMYRMMLSEQAQLSLHNVSFSLILKSTMPSIREPHHQTNLPCGRTIEFSEGRGNVACGGRGNAHVRGRREVRMIEQILRGDISWTHIDAADVPDVRSRRRAREPFSFDPAFPSTL